MERLPLFRMKFQMKIFQTLSLSLFIRIALILKLKIFSQLQEEELILLIAHGADPKIRDNDGNLALHYDVNELDRRNFSDEEYNKFKILVKHPEYAHAYIRIENVLRVVRWLVLKTNVENVFQRKERKTMVTCAFYVSRCCALKIL